MGRRIEYFCDECKQLFGDNHHINVKSGDIRLSYKNYSGEWVQSKFPIKCCEYHFCGPECLKSFFTNKYESALGSIEKIT